MNTVAEADDTARRPPPPVDFTQEIRYAVVMYGGVSLCIYINGVAQELLELSRATSCGPDGVLLHTPQGAGAVYRRIAQYLGSEDPDNTRLLEETDPKAPICTKFVVDVLSGTSAGGLNSLFLAKALANDQDMKGLKQLWMDEGEIKLLLNDAESVEREPGLDKPKKPASLLNSQRMYKKLLEALDAMDRAGSKGELRVQVEAPTTVTSPHVAELDCFITTTDIDGLPVQIKLQNAVATEQRHRNVFHFKFRDAWAKNDFRLVHNPFLAFAGRCTSAFPFAFEPMRLSDIDAILNVSPLHNLAAHEDEQRREEWRRFYRAYSNAGLDFKRVAFGDGGYLDNKPFTYATSTLMRRTASLPVRRKLIYIDPSPEAPKRPTQNGSKPDFIRNCMAALLELPRYETIREDIQAVLERNKLLDTVTALIERTEADVERGEREQQVAEGRRAAHQSTATEKPYEERGLWERMQNDSLGYGAYHRLRVSAVTVKLAHLIARIAGFDPASDECQAIRWIVECWRDATFAEEPAPNAIPFRRQEKFEPNAPRASQNSFLSAFDIDYRLRRIFFLQRRIGKLVRLRMPQAKEAGGAASAAEEGGRIARDDASPAAEPHFAEELREHITDAATLSDFRAELRRIKTGLVEPQRRLLEVERMVLKNERIGGMLLGCLVDKPVGGDTGGAVRRDLLAIERLKQVLAKPEEAATICQNHAAELHAIAREIADTFDKAFRESSSAIQKILASPSPQSPLTDSQWARILPSEPKDFDRYDAVMFPIQYGTDAGEASRIDVVRISPPDAPTLIPGQGGKARQKLAGTALFSFGAFLTRFWRENDMLWGRLDAAEILIRSLLQDTQAKGDLIDQLVAEAHRKILSETLTQTQREQLWTYLCEAFLVSSEGRKSEPPSQEEIRKAVADLLSEYRDLDQKLRSVLRYAASEDDEQLREYFRTKYEVRRKLVVEDQLRVAARAGRIISRMLHVLAQHRDMAALEKPTVLLARVMAVAWGIVEISIPRTLGYVMWDDWRRRAYQVGLLLLAAGLLWQPVLVAGIGILAATIFIDATRWWIADIVKGAAKRRPVLWAVASAFGLIVLLLAGWKVAELILSATRT